jgi:predicted component of type VI protein secretion system
MAIWNEIQEQVKELHQLLEERKQLDELYTKINQEYDRKSI